MLLRDALGETLRDARTRQNRTLRDVSTAANVSLGYLSEVERGRKEASSELLASICEALDLELAEVLDTVSRTIRTDAVAGLGKREVTANSSKAAAPAAAAVKANGAVKASVRAAIDPSLRIVLPYGRNRPSPSVR
ncbi:helix-turn-helix domain-containing protein [Nakamurella leprariae]|uniref:Helix-turn-helix transcriptional regulator n=1 Tax=Nakamurella leprariae TaxID=2803911 RepID=A0A938YA74_9ACTN|nr:helix-turn-helix transcriptional regulator [Nakamurella leprariae]MBM9466039.1 helix-turn-helix transcriptional regulator [Nakamurella leprariae]